MKHISSQSGFTIIEVVVVIVLLGIIGTAGFFAYQNYQHKPSSASQTQIKNPSPSITTSPLTGYLLVPEWGIKIKMPDADKATYLYSASGGVIASSNSDFDSSIRLVTKPGYLQDKTCDPAVVIFRSKIANEGAKKVGDYYYFDGGSPYHCTNAEDDALEMSLVYSFSPQNISLDNN